MKKSMVILGLALACLGLSATVSRADEPVLSDSGRFMGLPSKAATFTDTTLVLDANATHEVASNRESFNNADRRFTGHYEWFNRLYNGVSTASTPVREPSALLLLICGCLGLTALSRKLANSNS